MGNTQLPALEGQTTIQGELRRYCGHWLEGIWICISIIWFIIILIYINNFIIIIDLLLHYLIDHMDEYKAEVGKLHISSPSFPYSINVLIRSPLLLLRSNSSILICTLSVTNELLLIPTIAGVFVLTCLATVSPPNYFPLLFYLPFHHHWVLRNVGLALFFW